MEVNKTAGSKEALLKKEAFGPAVLFR